MRVLIEIIFKQTWIFFVATTFINAFVLKARSKRYIVDNPELEDGYKKLFKGVIFYGNIPWIIMAIGNVSRLTISTFDYFAPRQMNPIVLLFHFSIIILWIASIKWIYFQKGAEFLESHPGLLRPTQTAQQIKLFFPLMLLGGIIGMVMMWVKNPSIPNFH